MGTLLSAVPIHKQTLRQEICGNRIKAGFFNVKIQDIAVHGTNDCICNKVMDWCILISNRFDNKQVRVIILALCSTLHDRRY